MFHVSINFIFKQIDTDFMYQPLSILNKLIQLSCINHFYFKNS